VGYSLEGALQKAFELTIAPPRLMVLLAGLTAYDDSGADMAVLLD